MPRGTGGGGVGVVMRWSSRGVARGRFGEVDEPRSGSEEGADEGRGHGVLPWVAGTAAGVEGSMGRGAMPGRGATDGAYAVDAISIGDAAKRVCSGSFVGLAPNTAR